MAIPTASLTILLGMILLEMILLETIRSEADLAEAVDLTNHKVKRRPWPPFYYHQYEAPAPLSSDRLIAS